MSTQKDNKHYGAKLLLRRFMLRRYHADREVRVIDCCAGTGQLWKTLRAEWPVRYMGLDVKGGRGLLKMDSARYLARRGWSADLVDIDTYGEPWAHWFEVLRNARPGPLTVLLTIGSGRRMAPVVSDVALAAAGIDFRQRVPLMLASTVHGLCADFCIAKAKKRSNIVGLHEVEAPGFTRYLGVHLEVGKALEDTP